MDEKEDIFSRYLKCCCELCDFKVKQRPDFEIHLDENHNEITKPEENLFENMELPEYEQNWNDDVKLPEISEGKHDRCPSL